jgi:hypothetical protein
MDRGRSQRRRASGICSIGVEEVESMFWPHEVERSLASLETSHERLAATVATLTAKVDQIEAAYAEVAVSKRRDERAFALILEAAGR